MHFLVEFVAKPSATCAAVEISMSTWGTVHDALAAVDERLRLFIGDARAPAYSLWRDYYFDYGSVAMHNEPIDFILFDSDKGEVVDVELVRRANLILRQ